MINKPVAVLLVAVVFLLVLTGWRMDCLTLRLPDQENRIVYLIPMAPGDDFSLIYRHSVEKTLVKGVFQISREPAILAKETWMESVGTGLPNTFFKRTRQRGGWIVVDEGLSKIENFRFFISWVNSPVLSTPSGGIDLTEFASGTVILLGAEEISLGYQLFHRVSTLVLHLI